MQFYSFVMIMIATKVKVPSLAPMIILFSQFASTDLLGKNEHQVILEMHLTSKGLRHIRVLPPKYDPCHLLSTKDINFPFFLLHHKVSSHLWIISNMF